jgi:divalent metal cation (Fe/Co/Zn/Cd) transporter
MTTPTLLTRQHAVQRGRKLEHFTIAWNSLEALVSLIAGMIAGSVSLVGFGMDSLIEVVSGTTLLWRLHHDQGELGRERAERITLRIVGGCFLGLATYISFEAASSLIRHGAPEKSIPGIVIAALAVVVMPFLGRAKRKVATEIGSGALRADAKQADFCAYLSAILLVGLLLNALAGWWWADPAAALVMVPIIAKEGVNGLRAKSCDCDGVCH